MGLLAILLIILLLAIVGKSMLGFSLVLPLVLAVAFRLEARESFIIAFLGGLIVSLINGTVLGRESLGLLLATGLIYLYGKRFSARHWAYFGVFVGIGSAVNVLVIGGTLVVWRVVADVVLAVLFLQLVSGIKKRYFSETIVLKV